ncbi:MAG: ABC transporter permease [Abditibacteriota bacterium]|nr:ABC transporter permease [Abditibacteriota bacterium]
MNKTLRLIDYSISEAIESIRRNGYAGLAVVSTTAFTLCILWSFVMVSVAAAGYTDRQVDRFEISVFMKVDSTLEDAEALANKIKALPGVGKVTLKQKEEEWENFKIKHSYLDAGGLPIDTLPYAMSVQPKSPEDTVSVAEAIRKLQGIDAVFERQEFYTKILAISKVIKWAGLIGAAVLFFVCAAIIGNAIKLSIYARRLEIQTMQLVGATWAFIRSPFIYEGMFFGACGAVIGAVVVILGNNLISSNIRTFLKMTELLQSPMPGKTVFWGMLLCGVAIGALGSLNAVNRFITRYASPGESVNE